MNRQEIHQEMLNDISDKYDKRVGEFVFDVTQVPANQLGKLYEYSITEIADKLDIANLTGDELARRIKERTGITRRLATYAVGTLVAVGNGTINQGDIFETESGLQFEAVEAVTIAEEGTVKIRAIEAGASGNVPAQQITFMPVTLDNIDSVVNPQPTYDGFDAESDESLLQRYYERIQTPATSGNKWHYHNWAKEVQGVGDVRVFPLWDGDNTVKVVIIDANKQPASAEIVDEVQEYIDPGITGLGDGQAPIGAFCTVVSAESKDINIAFNLVLQEGYDEQDVLDTISENVIEYLKDIAFMQNFVSYAQIGSIIINSEGVADYTNLTVNGGTENIAIADDEVAVLGGVAIA